MAIKKLHTIVAVLGIGLAAVAAWWWQQQGPADGGPAKAANAAPAPKPGGPAGPVSVEVGKVQSVVLTDDVLAVGSLRSRQSVMLKPEVSGRVASLGFRDGQAVKRGQLLVQLDDTLQLAQLQQAQAQASIARTNLERSRELVSQGFISQSAVDQNAAALEVAMAQVALAQAQLSRMKILSPFDGMAGIRQVSVGDYLKDGSEIVGVEDLSLMLVDFRLPERYIAQIKVGLTIELLIDALPDARFKGVIEALDSQVDANGRSLLVRARVDNPGTQLKAGLFVRPRVVFGVRQGALVVPEEALVPQGGKQYLYKITNGDGGQVLAKRIEAQIGLRQPGRVEILGGLSANDQVVTAGQSRLRGDSAAVRVIDLANPAGGGGAASRPSAPGVAASNVKPTNTMVP